MVLPRYLLSVLVNLKTRGLRGPDWSGYLFLGDQVTWPSYGALEFLLSYVTQEQVKDHDQIGDYVCPGLKLKRDQIIAIPGNHDKLMRSDLSIYHEQFSIPAELPPFPQPRRSYFVSRQFDNIEFLFVLVEASVFADTETEGHLTLSSLKHLACGSLIDSLQDEIHSGLRHVREGRQVDEASVFSFDRCIKVLVVHYAPDVLAVTGAAPGVRDLIVSHACDGLAALVESLKGQIDLVVHGHLHAPWVYAIGGIPIISVGSVSQRGQENSFCLLLAREGGELAVEYHKWTGTGFALDTRPDLTRPLR
jgi:predicted phosphodiesterase